MPGCGLLLICRRHLLSYDLIDLTSHLLSLCNLNVHCVDLNDGKVLMSQIGDGMSGIHLYFYIRHICDGSVVRCTRVQNLTPMEIP